MHKLLIVLVIAVLGTSAVAYSYLQDKRSQSLQISDLSRQLERLMAELEQNARQRIINENRIEQLNSEVAISQSRVRGLDEELVETRQQIDPDYQQIEDRIRQRLDVEYRNRLATTTMDFDDNPVTVASIISQLSNLSSEERMALISVQGQYGSFLDSLNISSERKDRIAQALVDINLGQIQARQDLLSQELEPQEMARQMRAIMSPRSVRESVAYDLTDDELTLFDEFLQQQRTTLTAGAIGRNGVFMVRGNGVNAAELIQQQGADIIINADANAQPGQRIIIQQSAPITDNPR